MKKSLLTESISSFIEDEKISVTSPIEETKKIRKQQLEEEFQEKLAALETGKEKPLIQQTDAFRTSISMGEIQNAISNGAVEECKKYIKNFKNYLEEKQKELDQEKNPPQIIQSINKNAYEIRLQILELAVKVQSNAPGGIQSPQQVLTTAGEFYKFVENRR